MVLCTFKGYKAFDLTKILIFLILQFSALDSALPKMVQVQPSESIRICAQIVE